MQETSGNNRENLEKSGIDPETAYSRELYMSAPAELQRLVFRFLELSVEDKAFLAFWREAEAKKRANLSAEEVAELIDRWELIRKIMGMTEAEAAEVIRLGKQEGIFPGKARQKEAEG